MTHAEAVKAIEDMATASGAMVVRIGSVARVKLGEEGLPAVPAGNYQVVDVTLDAPVEQAEPNDQFRGVTR
jgi:hypothetical protein